MSSLKEKKKIEKAPLNKQFTTHIKFTWVKLRKKLSGTSLAYNSPARLQPVDKRKHTGAGRRCWKPRPSSSSAPHCHEETVHHCRREKAEFDITEISELGMESCVMNLHTHTDPETQLVKWHSLIQVSQFNLLCVRKAQHQSHSALLNLL